MTSYTIANRLHLKYPDVAGVARGAILLSKLMKSWKNRALRNLYLGYCNISGEGSRSICDAVSRLPLAMTLAKLDLTANFLKEDGATALATMLKSNKRIKCPPAKRVIPGNPV